MSDPSPGRTAKGFVLQWADVGAGQEVADRQTDITGIASKTGGMGRLPERPACFARPSRRWWRFVPGPAGRP